MEELAIRMALKGIKDTISKIPSEYRSEISDGYHTFNELYEVRMALTAAFFNNMPAKYKSMPHKSKRHCDGELCFGGDWFIVSAMLPDGQISFHYPMKYWDYFKINETEKALFIFDGHTTKDVISRLLSC